VSSDANGVGTQFCELRRIGGLAWSWEAANSASNRRPCAFRDDNRPSELLLQLN